MKYKDNVLNKLTQLDTLAGRLQLQVNRGMSQDEVLASIEQLKEGIDAVRSIVSLEHDNFEAQFNRG